LARLQQAGVDLTQVHILSRRWLPRAWCGWEAEPGRDEAGRQRSQAANLALPPIEKQLAQAAEADAAEDARYGDALAVPTPRTLATRAKRRDPARQSPDRHRPALPASLIARLISCPAR
jgi:hypothetical protein